VSDGRATREKLYGATRRLAGGMGPVKARLRAALTPEVMALQADDFPWPDLGLRFDGMLDDIAPDRSTHIVLMQRWDFELSHIAEEIVDIYDQVARRFDVEYS
jgi:hypothetical protein